MSGSSMMYSIVITTGPVRASTGTAVVGAFHSTARSGSRLISPVCNSGAQRPSTTPARTTAPEIRSARLIPMSDAASPHSQLPAAMPPNAAI
jgi:hypothetical protein